MKPRSSVRDGGKDGPKGGKIGRTKKPLSRKERRKQERFAKKKRTALFHSRKANINPSTRVNGRSLDNNKKKLRKVNRTDLDITNLPSSKGSGVVERERGSRSKSSKSRQLTVSSLQLGDKAGQSAAITREDKEIARLEKLLKMKKRKKLPSSFKQEGLDCIQSHSKCTVHVCWYFTHTWTYTSVAESISHYCHCMLER